MPSKQQVKERLAQLLTEIGKIPRDHISDTATVDDALQMGSLAFVELQVALEEEYHVLIDPVHVVELNEFAAIVDYVHGCAESAEQ